jgi:hypothetical protein
MNLHSIRTEFDRIMRSLGDSTFEDWRDSWINLAWLKLSAMFVIPSLVREITIDSVADQNLYLLPYDFNDAEIHLWFKDSDGTSYKRLDPVQEDVLSLAYERRTGSRGVVQYYDVSQNIGSDLAVRTCDLVNGSATVACVDAENADVGYWIRFDPFVVVTDTVDPGDYGYEIVEAEAGVSLTLDRTYRGDDGTGVVGRVRPAEQQQFITYGIPNADVTDAFKLKYYSKPRRLYNPADVLEWPNAGIAVAHMAVSIAMDYLMHYDNAKVWFGRAMSHINNLHNRQGHRKTLVSDLTVGTVSRRKTGIRSVGLGRALSSWR